MEIILMAKVSVRKNKGSSVIFDATKRGRHVLHKESSREVNVTFGTN